MNSDSTGSDRSDRDDTGDVRWTLLDIDELEAAYWDVVAPAFAEAGHDPETERPTHEWLSANGFRGLIYALREYHDRTFAEFWGEDLGLAVDDGYDWGIDHELTIDLLEAYLDSRRDRGDLRESSIETLRYRLARYVRAYAAENDTEDLLTPVARDSEAPAYEATDAAWRAVDALDSELAPRTVRRIHEAVDGWYAHLVRRKRAAINPVADLDEEYNWSRQTDAEATNPALAAEHVRRLYEAASDPGERVLIVACCGWGLRSGEVAALHRDQLVLDVDEGAVPYIEFEERKNGPGQVNALYGEGDVQDRIIELGDREAWNGYLFPSGRSASGHVSAETVRNRFEDLAKRAELPETIGGRKPVPQMGRRFWYDAYTAAQEQVLQEVEEIAAEQGSASGAVVMQEYLSPERRRQLRRRAMAEQLGAAFDGTPE